MRLSGPSSHTQLSGRRLRVNGGRLWESLMDMAQIGKGAQDGCNRQALTLEDGQARDLFMAWVSELGCETRIDQVGNIFARYAGSDKDAHAVATGSHLDTQPTGGKFDGVYGVLAGVEVLRVMHEAGVRTRRPVEVIVWTNEEGCRFAPAMLGSGVVAGQYDLDFAYSRTDKDGQSLLCALEAIGYRGDALCVPSPYVAMIETHIEQGPVLEHHDDTIGVVTGIQGAYWYDITLTGQSCHAGPTPMSMRRDPWRAATEVITAAYDVCAKTGPDARCTIGDMTAHPGSRNTVPEKLIFPIDIRHPDLGVLDHMVEQIRGVLKARASAHRLESSMERVFFMPPTTFAPQLCDIIEQSARDLNLRVRRMVSGAGHDSLHTAKFAPTAMIFVPCAGGLSHNEAESASQSDLTAGADVLLQTLIRAAEE